MKTVFLLQDKKTGRYLHKSIKGATTWRFSQAMKFEDIAMARLFIIVYGYKKYLTTYEMFDFSQLPKPELDS
jgi:hypothetical protein